MFGFRRAAAAPGLSAADAVRLAENGEVTLVDVRNTDEVARTGKAAKALNIPLMQLSSQADPRSPAFRTEFAAGRPIVVYCASGARSGGAVEMLRRMGHAEAYNIGGLQDWLAAGGRLG